MNKVPVKINGVEYNLKGEENAEYLHSVANYVDKKLKEATEVNSKLSTSSAAVLTAVNAVDDMFKMKRTYEEFLQGYRECKRDSEKLSEQVESLKKHVKHMEEYNAELQNKIKSLNNDEILKDKSLRIVDLETQLELMTQTAQEHMKNENKLKEDNKEFKFQLQSSKYKIIELQNKLLESQIDLAKTKNDKKAPLRKK